MNVIYWVTCESCYVTDQFYKEQDIPEECPECGGILAITTTDGDYEDR